MSHTFHPTRRHPGGNGFRRRVAGVATLALASTALAALAVSGASPAAAAGPALLPLEISNDSGRSEAVFVYVLGVDLTTGRLGYSDAAGKFTNWPAGANPPVAAPDVAITGPGNGGSTTVRVPRGMSGRVYFSFGRKLDFRLTPDGLVQPAPWSAGDPNRETLFDWSEFTYNDAGLWLNSSQVDMFAVPHEVSVVDSSGREKSTGALVAGGRDAVIRHLRSLPDWAGSVQTRSDGTVLRVLAPGKVTGSALATTYLDPYITKAWDAYTTKDLTVVPFGDRPELRYTGRTTGNVMTFTDSGGRQVATFTKPSTSDVWGCDGRLGAPNDQVVGPIARTLCAALTRGTLGTVDTQPSTDASRFYRSNPANEYAKAVHESMADGKAYAFAFDDVGAFESLVHDGSPRSAAITLGRFTGGSVSADPPSSSTSPPAGSAAAAVSLVSNWNAKCIDVNGSVFEDGVPLQVYTCNGTGAQKWVFSGGTLRSSDDLCMDVAGGREADGTPIQLARCSGSAAQQFVLTAAGDLVNPQSDKCVDVKDFNPADRTRIQLWQCAGSANQKWHRA